jgi:ABC-type dipeptide/oligopeptide/nickel transport system permease subunit
MSIDYERIQAASVPPMAPHDLDEAYPESARRRLWRRFRHNKAAMVGLVVLTIIVLAALLAPLISPHDPNSTDPFNRGTGPSAAHWLGTDFSGRDALSRLIYGGRVSFEVCLLVVIFAIAAALPLGLTAGYFGGWWDYLVSRSTDALFAFPTITLALAVATIFKKGLLTAAIAIAVTFIPGFVRLIRAQVLAVREETYIEASTSVGVSERRMLFRHVLPNAITPLVVQIALSFGYALLAEAGLSFLGFGVQTPTASWGTMLQDAYNGLPGTTWPVFPPGIALAITVLAINLVADGLRDSLGRETFNVKALTPA